MKLGLTINEGHTYCSFDFSQLGIKTPTSPSWMGQWHIDFKSLDKRSGLPDKIGENTKACLLLTVMADGLAASISRTRAPDEKHDYERVSEGVRFLWKPDFYASEQEKGNYWAAFRSRDEMKEMFNFIENCSGPEELFTKYKTNLTLTPEDKSVPRNTISLRSHLDLTGKIFRVLWYWTTVINVNNRIELEYDGQKISNVFQAAGERRINKSNRGKWIFRLIKCYVQIPQSIARLQDLNVIKLRSELIEKIVQEQKIDGDLERQKYAVLFNTNDFICLFLPKEHVYNLSEVLKPLLQNGFWVEFEETEAELNLITSNASRSRDKLISNFNGDRDVARRYRHLELRHRSIWPELSETIEPPLCDLCQQRQGQRNVKDQIIEWLCPVCLGIRKMGEPATIISSWEEAEKRVLWLKVTLDQELLLQCLQRLFDEYVDNGPGMANISSEIRGELKNNFRPLASQMEFIHQYNEFLEEFQNILTGVKLYKQNKSLNIQQDAITYPIQAYKELAVVRIDRNETLGLILDVFNFLLKKRFPECLIDCPIQLSASFANLKYPYQNHWRFFEEKQISGSVYHLQQPGIRQIDLTSKQFEALREKLKGKKLSHALHRLADIETEIGELSAMVQALDPRSRSPQIIELIMRHKLRLKQILDFYRLVGVVSDEVMVDGE